MGGYRRRGGQKDELNEVQGWLSFIGVKRQESVRSAGDRISLCRVKVMSSHMPSSGERTPVSPGGGLERDVQQDDARNSFHSPDIFLLLKKWPPVVISPTKSKYRKV